MKWRLFILSLCAACMFHLHGLAAAETYEPTVKDVQSGLQNFMARNKYPVKILVGEFKASGYAKEYAKWENLSDDDAALFEKYAKIFMDEWGKYPLDFVKKTKLKAFAFVKKMEVMGQLKGAMPDTEAHVMYLGIDDPWDYDDPDTTLRYTLHHEYSHLIDDVIYGDTEYQDPKWLAFNPQGFKYVGSGDDAYQSDEAADKANEEHPQSGFVTGYAMFAIEEDRAETFSWLMTTPYYKKVMEWVKGDTLLAKKVNYMKAFIRKMSPSMNDAYFKKIHGL